MKAVNSLFTPLNVTKKLDILAQVNENYPIIMEERFIFLLKEYIKNTKKEYYKDEEYKQ